MNGELELRHLRVLVAVVEAGGHTRAASALGLSQSTVSETLASLERALGTRLLHRGRRGVVPTAAGSVLLRYARRILALAAEASARAAQAPHGGRLALAIGAVESVGAYLLPPALARLRLAWPDARVEVRTGLCAEIRGWVERGAIELGLVLEPAGVARAGGSSVLARSPLVLIGTVRTRSARQAPTAEPLKGRTFHLSDQAGSYHQALRRCLRGAGLPVPPLQAAGSSEGVKRAVLASSDAFGVLPAFAVAAELHAGKLEMVPLQPPLPMLEVKAVLPAGARRRPAPVVAQLLDELRAAASGINRSPPR